MHLTTLMLKLFYTILIEDIFYLQEHMDQWLNCEENKTYQGKLTETKTFKGMVLRISGLNKSVQFKILPNTT